MSGVGVWRLAFALLALAAVGRGVGLPAAAPLEAQEAATAAVGDTIRVGDVVPVAVRLTIGRDERVAWPDTLPLSEASVENAARVHERVDTLADGALEVTGLYRVTPWRTGEVVLPEVPLDVVSGREVVRTVTARLPALDVVSVLPPDTAGIEPKPARGVIGRSWALWPLLLALLALLALIGGLVWWRRRRRDGESAIALEPPVSPRERALAQLDAARAAGLIERGELKAFYTRTADALREFLAAVDADWGEDRTTSELLTAFRRRLGPEPAADLRRLLQPADQVKFARRRPDADTAVAEWTAARDWVAGFEAPSDDGEAGEAAA